MLIKSSTLFKHFILVILLSNAVGGSLFGYIDGLLSRSCGSYDYSFCTNQGYGTIFNYDDTFYNNGHSNNEITLLSQCCSGSNLYFNDIIGSGGIYYNKFIHFTNGVSLTNLYLEMGGPREHVKIYEENRPEGLKVIMGCNNGRYGCRTSVGEDRNTFIFVSTKSVSFSSSIEEMLTISYFRQPSTNVPEIYLEYPTHSFNFHYNYDFLTLPEYNSNNYILSGKVSTFSMIQNGSTTQYYPGYVCNRDGIKRYLAFINSVDNNENYDCTCKPQSNSIQMKIRTEFNYPDCLERGSIYDLDLTSLTPKNNGLVFSSSSNTIWNSIKLVNGITYNLQMNTLKTRIANCDFKSKTVVIESGELVCTNLLINSETSITINTKGKLTISTITIDGTIDNLNENGIIKSLGQLLSANNPNPISITTTSTTCYELVSSVNNIFLTTSINSGYSLIQPDNKLIRICPSNSINNEVICILEGTKISSGDYSQFQNKHIHCPCSTTNCIIEAMSKEFSINSNINGRIELQENNNYVIQINSQQTSYTFDGRNNTVYFKDLSIVGNQIGIKTTSDDHILFIGNNYGFEQTIETTTETKIGKDFTCKSMLISNGKSMCKICNNSFVDFHCLTNEETIPYCQKQPSINECEICENGYYLLNGKCETCPSKCNLCMNNYCVQCKDNYFLNQGNCFEISEPNKYVWRNKTLKCINNYYPFGNECGQCSERCESCNIINEFNQNECIICDKETVLKDSKKCETIVNAKIVNNKEVVECSDKFRNENGNCVSCDSFGFLCEKCTETKCTQCLNGFIDINGICSTSIESGCKLIESIKTSYCLTCDDDQFIYNGTICEINQNNCMTIRNNETCYECQPNYILNETTFECVEKTSEQFKYLENCSLWRGDQQDICLSCFENYYYGPNTSSCKECNSNCTSCINEFKCIECKNGYSLMSNKCILSSEVINNCKQTLQGGSKCAICNDHYYRVNDGLCEECIANCSKCFNSEKCIVCYVNNFLLDVSEICLSYDELKNCITKTSEGCIECEEGYYVSKQYCVSCNSRIQNCNSCDHYGDCNSCENEYVLDNNKCIYYSLIQKCQEAENSKCIKCSFWYQPNDKETECEKHAVWWLILILVLIVLMIIGLVILISAFLYKRINRTIRKKQIEKKMRLFNMSRSNVQFFKTENPNTVVNKKLLRFVVESVEEEEIQIPVGQETRQLICVGNKGKNTIKVQFSVKEGCDKYEIRCEPQLAIIPKGKAIEFEIFLKPLCTCKIEDQIVLFSLNMKKGETTESSVRINVETQLSEKLDYDELIEEQQLGEGSFGIVILGKFRGNKVAIKKMKQTAQTEESKKEFSKEVSMLDKFRSEYIIHFYGAVFIPNKICMVTEFAQFGSLQDLIKKQNETFVTMKMRIKMMIDSAKGIQYLHSNGILHRDIKPDNILVVAIDENNPVNVKLTDFGSARNINLMMTNMTFTKGIGTPTYMSPEVLKKLNYKKPADIYSFAITMYECFGWCEIYPKDEFKFPWKIADFVMDGKRRPKPCNTTNEQYQLIEKCWKQDPKQRMVIGDVVNQLQQIFDN